MGHQSLKLVRQLKKLRQQRNFRKTTEELENEAREVLEGHLRSILGSMTVEEIYQNRDKFSQSVQEVASVDLAKMGLLLCRSQLKKFVIKWILGFIRETKNRSS